MLLIRPLPPIPRAGGRKAARRFLLIETKSKPEARPPRFGARRYVFDDQPTVTKPTALLCTPARLAWDDVEFREIRKAVANHVASLHDLASSDEESDEHMTAKIAFGRTWSACEHLAFQVFNAEPLTIRDVFLRAEMLTMHYGDGQIRELLDSECPAHRLLGGLLHACWKVGGAAHV